jgi:hypothetical protein
MYCINTYRHARSTYGHDRDITRMKLPISMSKQYLHNISSPGPRCPDPAVLSQRPVPALLSLAHLFPLSGPYCHVVAVLVSLSYSSWPLNCQIKLSKLPCLIVSHVAIQGAMSWLFCHDYPTSVFLSWSSCPSSSARCPVLAVMFWPSCPFFHVLPVPSWLSSLAVLSPLFGPGFLSFPSCPFPDVFPSCSASAFLSPALMFPLSCLCCYVIIVLSCLFCLDALSYASCHSCPGSLDRVLLVVLIWLSNTVLAWLIKNGIICNKWMKKFLFFYRHEGLCRIKFFAFSRNFANFLRKFLLFS